AVLYVVNAFTGALIKSFEASAGSPSVVNGLSTPGFLYNEKRELVAAYAGDLQGNMWKFDLSSNTASDWKVAFSGSPLFLAKDKTANHVVQPITVPPALGYHPKGGYMVNFVTGKYFEDSDSASTQPQTVYGIWDNSDINGVTASVVTGARDTILQEQVLSADADTKELGGANLTTTVVDWKTKRGWFIDLTLGTGERGIGEPFITDDTTLWVTTLDPIGDPCSGGGDSRLMGFNFLSGTASDTPLFDTDGKDGVTSTDKKISVIKTGGTVASSASYKVPAPCGGAGQAACPSNTNCGKPGMPACPPPACQGSSRKVLINRLDGTTQEMSIARKCLPPLRVWHEMDVAY
ncbi:MAG: hypothetical protein HYZ45_07920, partial [Burkholderiales bacterium]|nr:hypothetical protein [Burkholderiales bacterium]